MRTSGAAAARSCGRRTRPRLRATTRKPSAVALSSCCARSADDRRCPELRPKALRKLARPLPGAATKVVIDGERTQRMRKRGRILGGNAEAVHFGLDQI